MPDARRGRRPARRSPACPAPTDPYPPVLTISMAKVETLRYGENPHQPAARYRRTDREPRAAEGPFASGEPPLQGKALSYNNVLDASAAAALARLMRGPAVVIVKHTNPCGAAERATLLEAWDAALAGDPVSAFGGVVGDHRAPSTARWPSGWSRSSSRSSSRPAFDDGALRGPGDQAQPAPGRGPVARRRRGPRAGSPRAACSTSTAWARSGPPAAPCSSRRPTRCPTTRPPGRARPRAGADRRRAARPRPRLAPVPGRRLERDRPRPRRDAGRASGSGQVSRVDACRGAVDKARQFQGEARRDGRRRRVGRVLPVRRRPAGAARRRRDRDRPARRLDARRRGPGGRRGGRRRDARDGDPALPPLTAAGARIRP